MSPRKKGLRSVAIISPYPAPGERSFYGSGVVTYSERLAKALAGHYSVSVIANALPGAPASYEDGGVRIYRTFSSNPLYLINIFRTLRRIRPDVVHIQHSYFLYGGFFEGALFPLLVLLCRTLSKVVVTMHDLPSPEQLDDKAFLKQNLLPEHSSMLKAGIRVVTKAIGLLADAIIVHESFLGDVATRSYGIPKGKLVIKPHGVNMVKPLDRLSSRDRLGIDDHKKLILFFGYLVGYKGIDHLIRVFRDRLDGGEYAMIIAGGIHPRARQNPMYSEWMEGIVEEVNRLKMEGREISLTGFVDDPSPYFSAADMVVLPYTTRFSASGPAAIAASYGVPVFITDHGANNIEEDIVRFVKDNGGPQKADAVPYWDKISPHYYSFLHGLNESAAPS